MALSRQRPPLPPVPLLQYCDRGSLRDAVRGGMLHRALPGGAIGIDLASAVEVLLDAAYAVQYLHSIGLIHGDIKVGTAGVKEAVGLTFRPLRRAEWPAPKRPRRWPSGRPDGRRQASAKQTRGVKGLPWPTCAWNGGGWSTAMMDTKVTHALRPCGPAALPAPLGPQLENVLLKSDQSRRLGVTPKVRGRSQGALCSRPQPKRWPQTAGASSLKQAGLHPALISVDLRPWTQPVLLCEPMQTPQLSDFGLTRILSESDSTYNIDGAGTITHLAPGAQGAKGISYQRAAVPVCRPLHTPDSPRDCPLHATAHSARLPLRAELLVVGSKITTAIDAYAFGERPAARLPPTRQCALAPGRLADGGLGPGIRGCVLWGRWRATPCPTLRLELAPASHIPPPFPQASWPMSCTAASAHTTVSLSRLQKTSNCRWSNLVKGR
jgi:serine/threonine protein kinase